MNLVHVEACSTFQRASQGDEIFIGIKITIPKRKSNEVKLRHTTAQQPNLLVHSCTAFLISLQLLGLHIYSIRGKLTTLEPVQLSYQCTAS